MMGVQLSTRIKNLSIIGTITVILVFKHLGCFLQVMEKSSCSGIGGTVKPFRAMERLRCPLDD